VRAPPDNLRKETGAGLREELLQKMFLGFAE
jgi:hypothetical protein